MSTRQTKVEIGGVEFTDDVLANVRIDMGARTAWEQNVAGVASILIRQDDPGIIISDDVRVRVESPDTPEATGGTESTITVDGVSYRLHVFTTDGTFTVTSPGQVEYLIVGGGGGGGGANLDIGGGGGGAGGLLQGTMNLSAGAHTVVVGAGGTKGTSTVNSGTSGGSSSFAGLTAIGGGRGAGATTGNVNSPLSGGSGGGGAFSSVQHTFGANGTPTQGFAGGGNGNFRGPPYPAGGGGGSAGPGSDASSASVAGDGGPGTSSSITGTAVLYAGGGGGAIYQSGGTAGQGAAGGGNGGVNANGQNAVDGSGSGGGGGGRNRSGGDGGDGIVIIRYRDTYQTVFQGKVDTTSAEITDIGPLWAVTASGPLTRAGRRDLNSIIAADTEGDQIALLAQEALATQWSEAPSDWTSQTLSWDGFAVDTSSIDQPGQYALAAIDDLPTNVVEAMTTAAFSGSGWLYETRTGLLGYADSLHREALTADDYITVPGSVTARNQFITVTREADIANDLIVEYDGGEVTGTATDSMGIYGRWQRTYTTTLADGSAAAAFLTRRLQLEGAPRMNVAGSILIDLAEATPSLFDELLTVERNTGIILENVPTYLAADGVYRGFVEGYVWNLGPIDPTLELFVSEYSLSNFGLRWAAVGPAQWNEVDASLAWQDATEALA